MIATALLAGLVGMGALAQDGPIEVYGPARAVNADTIQVSTTYVLLFGVESVEPTQRCVIDSILWDCYTAAVRTLEELIGAQDILCSLTGEPDFAGRWMGTCFAGGDNVNAALVRAGFALAKRDETLDYVADEAIARAKGIGLWQGAFQHPAEYRAEQGITIDRP